MSNELIKLKTGQWVDPSKIDAVVTDNVPGPRGSHPILLIHQTGKRIPCGQISPGDYDSMVSAAHEKMNELAAQINAARRGDVEVTLSPEQAEQVRNFIAKDLDSSLRGREMIPDGEDFLGVVAVADAKIVAAEAALALLQPSAGKGGAE